MRVPDISNSPDKIQLSRISHVYFEHPDLEAFETFSDAFGFVEAHRDGASVYYRGYGKDQYVYVASQSSDGAKKFKGGAFVAATETDFDKASRLPEARVSELKAPGGGRMVTIERPGPTYMHVVYGQEQRETPAHPPTATHEDQGPYNGAFDKDKGRKGRFQRYHEGPAMVHKLGHYGYVSNDFDGDIQFYTGNFNFVPSDVLHAPDNPDMDVLTFMHLDLGEEYSDHHSLFLARGPPELGASYLHHTSYEVEDFDTQLLGHHWLAKKGYESVWGVGRHILGSQIFDYWRDVSGFKIEHYADGDLVNNEKPTGRDVAGPVSIWGPEMPKTFNMDTTKLPPSI